MVVPVLVEFNYDDLRGSLQLSAASSEGLWKCSPKSAKSADVISERRRCEEEEQAAVKERRGKMGGRNKTE
jgi:hypothetical protein